MNEYLRPWKLCTFGIGLLCLIVGAYHYQIADWDVGVSLLMGGLTFLTAPFSTRALLQRRWRQIPAAVFLCWLSVDGIYTAYHLVSGGSLFRAEQWPTSLCLYLLCGCIWQWRGSLAEFGAAMRSAKLSHHSRGRPLT